MVARKLQDLLLALKNVVADGAVLALAAGSLGLDARECGDNAWWGGGLGGLVASEKVVEDGIQCCIGGEILWSQPTVRFRGRKRSQTVPGRFPDLRKVPEQRQQGLCMEDRRSSPSSLKHSWSMKHVLNAVWSYLDGKRGYRELRQRLLSSRLNWRFSPRFNTFFDEIRGANGALKEAIRESVALSLGVASVAKYARDYCRGRH